MRVVNAPQQKTRDSESRGELFYVIAFLERLFVLWHASQPVI